MKLTISQSYLAAFQLLDEIWEETNDEKLGNLLSEMNPYLFVNAMSADPAVYPEWVSCAKKEDKNEILETDIILKIIKNFLDFNQSSHDYDVNHIMSLIAKKVKIGRWMEIVQIASTISRES